ncbi:hypothetical protein RJ639_014403 [Escallonia herrerae]|uniref:Cation-transporting P-type ATPase C-terminal domain-containing protein n=1 Tax=Escallonia herrerae TaxID=1293975 RepID=A0AA88VK27_9ASTE|nr:hypothetical protein RJ639_014403 [Escallonia herrerae]
MAIPATKGIHHPLPPQFPTATSFWNVIKIEPPSPPSHPPSFNADHPPSIAVEIAHITTMKTLTINVAALVINVGAVISCSDGPLNTVQLFWVNLIMDTLKVLALASEPPTNHLMHRTPISRIHLYTMKREMLWSDDEDDSSSAKSPASDTDTEDNEGL